MPLIIQALPHNEEVVVWERVILRGTLVTSQAAAEEKQVWCTSAKNCKLLNVRIS